MSFGQKYVAARMDLDSHESLLGPNSARYIKNLIYSIEDTSTEAVGQGSQTGVYKPLRSNFVYVDDFALPDGDNHPIGKYSVKELKQVFFFNYNSNGNHGVYRINGGDRTIDTVYIGPALNFVLNPENFIHFGACWLEIVSVADPVTGEKVNRTFLFFTRGTGDQCFIAVEDAIETQGFNATLFPYFQGDYDPKILISMASPSPHDCIGIAEIPLDQNSVQLGNDLLFNTWQFRLRYLDVWGRPTEYGVISDMYIPGGGGCIAASTNIPRCLSLSFNAPPPHVNQVEVAYRNCNNTQWYLADTLDLYNGSPLGEWWTRQRNSKINYDSNTGKITYQFCAEQGCDPIGQDLTNRLENPIPRSSEAVTKIGSAIALSNNKDGFLPFSQDLKDKFKFTVTPASQTTNAARNIEIFVEIYNPYLGQNEPIYQGILTGNTKFYGFGSFGFGAGNNQSNIPGGLFAKYKQYFINPNQQGLIGYLAGTGAYVVSEQYAMDVSGNLTKVDDFSLLKRDPSNPVRWFQKFTFSNLSAQTYIFRIISPQSDPTVDPNYTKTSTYLKGSYSFNINTPSNPVNHTNPIDDAKELIINVCNGDYSTLKDNRMLVIFDLTPGCAVRAGYIKTTADTSKDPIGIELAHIDNSNPKKIDSHYTDHNGFFFVASDASGHGSTYHVSGMYNCKYTDFTGGIDTGSSSGLIVNNFFLDNDVFLPNYATQPCNFILIKGRVLICGTDIGVPNVGAVLSRGSLATTDNDGNFTIIAHDDCNGPNAQFISQSKRNDNLYFITSACSFTDCNGGCIAPISVSIIKCVSCSDRVVSVSDTSVMFISLRGLLSGGTYPGGVTGWDWADRPTFVQDLGNISIPSIYETKSFAPSALSLQIDPSAVFPPDTARLSVFIGDETSIADYVTWIVDSVVFIDNTGLENDAAPTQIKIFYASLIEYNKQNNFNTTVNWAFLATAAGTTTQTPVTSDKVQFLVNGDGTFFDKNIVSLVKYDQAGQFFLINYTPDLADLKPNARIRLFRPKQCTTTAPYFELCTSIDIVNGHASVNNILLNAYDTYYINRGLIPVPVAQDTNPVTFVNQPRLQGLPFEHNSPSDFWGQGCHNIGRSNAKNPQETIIYSKDQIALSGALSPTGQLNFLCYFDDAQKFSFTDNPLNGITAVLPYGVIILVIGQSDHFVIGFNDNTLRVDSQGQVTVPSAQDKFGQPQGKITPKYGCLLFDKNTIYEKNALVHWLDTAKGYVVQHNYVNAEQVTQLDPKRGIPGGVDSWLRPKIKEVQNFNLANGNNRYFHGVINTQGNEYILSDYTIGSTQSVNNLRQVDVTMNETISMGIFSKFWKTFYGFTAALYAELEGEIDSQQLFSFVNGIPNGHYDEIDQPSYGKMYGQSLVRVIEPVMAIDNLRNKKPLAIGVMCKESQYFSDRVVSSTGQQTRMLLAAWIQASFGWFAPFYCDLNTPFDPNRSKQTKENVLLDGNMLIGTWIKVRLIGDPSMDTSFSEMQATVVSIMPDVTNLETPQTK
jgi:hypothetical protein